ncbi:MAG: sensor domain-containing diguanylate cyclase [Candidatus Thiodiazotropha sp.]
MDLSFNQTSMDLRERFFSLLDSLSALRALSQINLSNISEEELIRKALEQLIRYQNLDNSSVYCIEGELLNCVARLSMEESHSKITGTFRERAPQKSMAFRPGEGIVGIAYETGQLQYCRNCSQSRDFVLNSRSGGDIPGSLISTPIKMGDQVLGVLNASHPMPEYFEPWQQHTLSLFSSCLGQIIYNHRMLNNLECIVEQRTYELDKALNEEHKMRKRFEQLSVVDELTGLYNRRYFFHEAEAQLSRIICHEQSCSLMLIDIDNFKLINDQWGHLAGDQVLGAIARVLKGEARGGDIVARVGGEEFAIMLLDAGREGADLMAQRIQERLPSVEVGPGGIGMNLTACIGITTLARDYDQKLSLTELLDQLYSQADNAMYDCKQKGCNKRKHYQLPSKTQ